MKEALCKAFCDELSVRLVGAGLAITMPFDGLNGEPVGFYVIRDGGVPPEFHLEDDGTTVPELEANGIDFATETRKEAFQEILSEHRANYDPDKGTLSSNHMPEGSVPSAALRFSAMLLRLQDFMLLTPERVANTFKADASRIIKDFIGPRAQIAENQAVSEDFTDLPADLIIRAAGRDPVVVFFGVSEQRLSDAVMLQMSANYEKKVPLNVIGVLERENSLAGRYRRFAANRLTALTYFRGDETATIQRIEKEVFGVTGPVAYA